MKRLAAILVGMLLAFNVAAFNLDDRVEVTSGPQAGEVGTVVALYKVEDGVSVAVKFDEDSFGLFREESLKEVTDKQEPE